MLANIKTFVEARLARDSRELERLSIAVAGLERGVSLANQRLDAASGTGDEAAIAIATAERDRLTGELLATPRSLNRARGAPGRLPPRQLDAPMPNVVEINGGAFR